MGIHDIFSNLLYCICFVLTQSTSNVNTKQWIKNDYMLIREDIHELIKSFEDDIESEFIRKKCLRIKNILEMIHLSTVHLTQHTLPLELQNFNPYCSHKHLLHECIVHPDKLKNFQKSRKERKEGALGVKLIKCKKCALFINIDSRVEEIGYYFCGHLACLKKNIFY